MFLKVAFVALFVAGTMSHPQSHPTYTSPTPTYGVPGPQAPARYDFNWTVKDDQSGNDYGQQESRDGDNTHGSYHVLLPDGRVETVVYTVNGDSGYVAEVTYQGQAQHPTHQTYTPVPVYG
nr:cuticle protein 19-like [Cherax quadricarinatus]